MRRIHRRDFPILSASQMAAVAQVRDQLPESLRDGFIYRVTSALQLNRVRVGQSSAGVTDQLVSRIVATAMHEVSRS